MEKIKENIIKYDSLLSSSLDGEVEQDMIYENITLVEIFSKRKEFINVLDKKDLIGLISTLINSTQRKDILKISLQILVNSFKLLNFSEVQVIKPLISLGNHSRMQFNREIGTFVNNLQRL